LANSRLDGATGHAVLPRLSDERVVKLSVTITIGYDVASLCNLANATFVAATASRLLRIAVRTEIVKIFRVVVSSHTVFVV